jgi:hypothetical protein
VAHKAKNILHDFASFFGGDYFIILVMNVRENYEKLFLLRGRKF